MKTVREVMTANPRCCKAEDSIYDAVRIMQEKNCGAVPITDNDEKCVGIVTDRDICLYTVLNEANPRQIKISATMSSHPFTCSPDDVLDTIIQRMAEQQVRRMLVVDQMGKCVGIVAQADVSITPPELYQDQNNPTRDTGHLVVSPTGLFLVGK